jgi:hypothetical protein
MKTSQSHVHYTAMEDTPMTTLEFLLRQRRFTQITLGQQVGTSQTRVSLLERGKLAPDKLGDAARENLESLFGKPLPELLMPVQM